MLAFKFLLVVLLLAPSAADAFPSNSRLGYSSCTSCHVSPTGGGVLNGYGRMSASEFLSTWSYANEEEPLHGALHEWVPNDGDVFIGGDVRYIDLASRRGSGSLRKSFFMQEDLELALPFTPDVTLVASGGNYAKDLDGHSTGFQSRRHYVLFNMDDWISFRVGRFFPAYGIMVEDHTVATRQGLGFDEGGETYNAEVALRSEVGELIATGIASGSSVTLQSDTGVVSSTNAVALRATAYVGKASQVGLSAMHARTSVSGEVSRSLKYGAFANVGFTSRLYLLSEVDLSKTATSHDQLFSYNLLGYELVKGLHVGGVYQRRADIDQVGWRLQWFPRPHFELAAGYLRDYGRAPCGKTVFKADTATLLVHYYL